jgi:hypothetical protein
MYWFAADDMAAAGGGMAVTRFYRRCLSGRQHFMLCFCHIAGGIVSPCWGASEWYGSLVVEHASHGKLERPVLEP